MSMHTGYVVRFDRPGHWLALDSTGKPVLVVGAQNAHQFPSMDSASSAAVAHGHSCYTITTYTRRWFARLIREGL